MISESLINEDQFESISHYVINPASKNHINDSKRFDLLDRNAIIYCKTDYVEELFRIISNPESIGAYPSKKNQYILITNSSDFPIGEKEFMKKPDNIKKWFAVNVLFDHESLIPIPLGLSQHEIKGGFSMNSWDEMIPFNQTMWFSENFETLREKEKMDILYCCWNDRTMFPDYSKSRNSILDELDKSIRIIRANGLKFKDNIKLTSEIKYILSPPGNGLDCHRNWESLYLGCIPVVKKNMIYDKFNLPFIQVEDWSNITMDMLESFDPSGYSMDQLDMRYWKKRILEEFNLIQ